MLDMLKKTETIKKAYWPVVIAIFGATTVMLFVYAPVEETMGPVQKIFYIHLPSAICTFLACMVSFIAAVGYLWQRKMFWDDLSAAAAKVAVLLCTVVLLTGMVWGHAAWGRWWTFQSPRLVFSLLLWLLYVVYIVLRASTGSGSKRAIISAVYSVAAFLDVPLVWLSVRLIPDPVHPASVTMTDAMRHTLLAWFIPVTLLTIGLIIAGKNRHRRLRERELLNHTESTWTVAPAEPIASEHCNEQADNDA